LALGTWHLIATVSVLFVASSSLLIADEPLLNVVFVEPEGNQSVVSITGFIEGISSGTEVLMVNRTGRAYSNLLAQSGCGCLKPVDVDGRSWDVSESIKVRFRFLPNTGRFQQTCKLSGNVEGLGRVEIGTLTIEGIVAPPIRLSQSSFTLEDIRGAISSGGAQVNVKLSREDGVAIDFENVRFASDSVPIRVQLGTDKSSLDFIFDGNADFKVNQVFPLVFPLKFEGNEYQFTLPVTLVTERVEITPRVLVFRELENPADEDGKGRTFMRSKFVVRGNGVQIESAKLHFGFASKGAIPENVMKPESVKLKQVASSIVLVELFVAAQEVPPDAEEIVLMTGTVDACRIPFVLK
jgi:hypothetical protein